MSATTGITVYAQGHPANSWVLYALAVPYIALDGGQPQALRWGPRNVHAFTDLTAGRHELLFELRYVGFRKPIASAAEAVTLRDGETIDYRVRNGWTNQHPFTFSRVH